LLLVNRRLDLSPAYLQHSSQLVNRQLFVEDGADLVKLEAEVAQGHEAVESSELVGRVVAISGNGIDPARAEQSDLVVVVQHPRRHLAESGEVSNGQHGVVIYGISHWVKVKSSAEPSGGGTGVLLLEP
jgi:hypothetical protein